MPPAARSFPGLSQRAKLALWLVAAGLPRRIAAKRARLAYGYLRLLAASPTGREFITRFEDEARRALGTQLARRPA